MCGRITRIDSRGRTEDGRYPDRVGLSGRGAKIEQLHTDRRFADQTAEPTALAGDDYSMITLERLFDFVDAYADSQDKTPAQRDNARQVLFNIETKREPRHPELIDDGFDGENPATFERRLVELIEERGL